MAKKLNVDSDGAENMAEFAQLVESSETAVELCWKGCKRMLSDACDKKTVEAFSPFISKDGLLFQGAAVLVDAGFFKANDEKMTLPALSTMLNMHTMFARLLTTSITDLGKLTIKENN